MANVYVWSGATGAGTGADWTNAYVSLNAAMTAKAAGDVFFVAHDHAQTQASALTITSPGTEATPCRVYCVNRAGSVPPVSADLRTTATITTTGAFGITVNGSVSECNGIIFSAGSGAVTVNLVVGSSSTRTYRLVNCSLRMAGTGAGGRISIGSGVSGAYVYLENTTVQFGSATNAIWLHGVTWRNTAPVVLGATIPATFCSINGDILLEGLDLSPYASGKKIADLAGGVSDVCTLVLKDCKLGASVTVATPPLGTSTTSNMLTLIRCDSGDTNYRTERHTFLGVMTTEPTIVHTGGASDGAKTISWKIVTTINSRWEWPFECLPISVWNETTGSAITVTVQGIWGTGTVPNNDDIWIDVEYLGTSGFPLASKATSTKADGLSAGTALAAGSGTWGGSTTKFAMAVTLTPQEKGPLTIYVRAAKASSTFYVDPKPVIT
jgi:hypothetical protein